LEGEVDDDAAVRGFLFIFLVASDLPPLRLGTTTVSSSTICNFLFLPFSEERFLPIVDDVRNKVKTATIHTILHDVQP
jgi:hypothetical protein